MSKKCINCGAPQGDSEKNNCDFCGNILQVVDSYSSIELDFKLIQYEFVRRNYEKVIELCDSFLEKEKLNIPIWTFKILAESYELGEQGAISRIYDPIKAAFMVGVFNGKNRKAVENILNKEITEKLSDLIEDAKSQKEALAKIEMLENYLSREFINAIKNKILSISEFRGNLHTIDMSEKDSLFEDAARLIVKQQIGSTSLLQRRMKLGYNRAGRLMDQLEIAGIVGPSQGSHPRDVMFKTEKELDDYLKNLL
jgi:Ftsk gamma domain